MDGVTQKLATETFEGVDQAKYDRICAKVKELTGIDMVNTLGSATAPPTATAEGITLSWVYSSSERRLVIDLMKRSWFDPSVSDIEEKLSAWIQSA